MLAALCSVIEDAMRARAVLREVVSMGVRVVVVRIGSGSGSGSGSATGV